MKTLVDIANDYLKYGEDHLTEREAYILNKFDENEINPKTAEVKTMPMHGSVSHGWYKSDITIFKRQLDLTIVVKAEVEVTHWCYYKNPYSVLGNHSARFFPSYDHRFRVFPVSFVLTLKPENAGVYSCSLKISALPSKEDLIDENSKYTQKTLKYQVREHELPEFVSKILKKAISTVLTYLDSFEEGLIPSNIDKLLADTQAKFDKEYDGLIRLDYHKYINYQISNPYRNHEKGVDVKTALKALLREIEERTGYALKFNLGDL